jgi:hypothetical protein
LPVPRHHSDASAAHSFSGHPPAALEEKGASKLFSLKTIQSYVS